MRSLRYLTAFFLIILTIIFFFYARSLRSYCFTGAFLADKPSRQEIINFNHKYGKNPFMVLVFIDWNSFLNQRVIEDVYSQGCVLFVTWEPWNAGAKQAIDYDGVLSGEYEKYITEFAMQIKGIGEKVFIRFAHEANGNWYPWSVAKIGKEKYVAIHKYIRSIFDKVGVRNAEWVFSINWEDVPKENSFMHCYPGDEYVDFMGIDGYNWGNTQPWSRWMGFREIFTKRYNQLVRNYKKPIIISEFSSASRGGDKATWIKEAMGEIRKMKHVKAFILFNVDKETDWSFSSNRDDGKELRLQLEDSYFRDKNNQGGLDN